MTWSYRAAKERASALPARPTSQRQDAEDRRALLDLVDRLSDYAEHRPGCRAEWITCGPGPCDCGLAEVRAAMEG